MLGPTSAADAQEEERLMGLGPLVDTARTSLEDVDSCGGEGHSSVISLLDIDFDAFTFL